MEDMLFYTITDGREKVPISYFTSVSIQSADIAKTSKITDIYFTTSFSGFPPISPGWREICLINERNQLEKLASLVWVWNVSIAEISEPEHYFHWWSIY